MDDNQVERLIDNERDWRKFLVNEVREIRVEITRHGKEIEKLKVWTWIMRSATVGVLGAIVAYFQSKLK